MKTETSPKNALVILFAGIFFNLSIGVLYSWSTIKKALMLPLDGGGFGYDSAQAGLPYTFAIALFAFGLLLGGRIQDKIGPTKVITAGALMIGAGMVLSGLVGNKFGVTGLVLTFGVLTGTGTGFGYGCVSPPALKWFHPSQKGTISGFIVGGYGIAPLYFAPLTSYMLKHIGIEKTLLYIGIAILIISTTLAQFIKNPPEGYVAPEPKNMKKSDVKKVYAPDVTWREMVKTKDFTCLFIMFTISSSVGLMIIGNVTKIVQIHLPDFATQAALFVSFLAITNTSGRVIGGIISDKIGRVNTLILVFITQSANMFLFATFKSLPMLLLGLVLTGFSYGTLLSVFPTITADKYGMKNYGLNYGVLYISWGIAGVIAPMMADFIYDLSKASGGHGNFDLAYLIAGGMMVCVTVVAFILRSIEKSRTVTS